MHKQFVLTTELINKWQEGDSDALNQLISHVYLDLNRIAKALMRRERLDHTLTPSALVNELYISLNKKNYNTINDRVHLLSLLALELRQILVSHARKKSAAKRAGVYETFDMDIIADTSSFQKDNSVDLVSLAKVLEKLHKMDSEACQIVELRFFCGFTVNEIAQTLDTTERTVYRRFSWAQTWLYSQLA